MFKCIITISLFLLIFITISRIIKNNYNNKFVQKQMEEIVIKEFNLNENYRKLFEWIDKNVPKTKDTVLNIYFMHVINVLFGDICTLKINQRAREFWFLISCMFQ